MNNRKSLNSVITELAYPKQKHQATHDGMSSATQIKSMGYTDAGKASASASV